MSGANPDGQPIPALTDRLSQRRIARNASKKGLLARLGRDEDRLAYAFRSATARSPSRDERTLLSAALSTQRQHFAAAPEEARKVITNGESKPSAAYPAPEFAAWTMVANLLLNLDETVTRN